MVLVALVTGAHDKRTPGMNYDIVAKKTTVIF